MQNKIELSYEELKSFFSFYVERYLNDESVPPDKRPMASLEALEKKSKKLALRGLREAIKDCMEMSSHFGNAEVAKLDSELRDCGIVTLSELRRRITAPPNPPYT